jgi:hypothetical protein
MYKVHDNFSAMLIGAEGARLLENAIAFPSCVGGFKDVIVLREYGAGETPQAQVAPRRLPGPPLERKSTDKFNNHY